MPMITTKSPCLEHPDCDVVIAACRVEVDPDSDPVRFPCAAHGNLCRFRWATCKRRRCSCERPTEPVRDLMIASAELNGQPIEDYAEMVVSYERAHTKDGAPRSPHRS